MEDRDGLTRNFGREPDIALKRGDLVRIITGGGGGWGEAGAREAESVRRDVENGYITKEEAKSRYGFEERVAV